MLGPAAGRIWDPRGLRPPRADIAIPPFPAATEWIGEEPVAVERIAAGGPVLVHFFDFAQLNSVRALPYLAEWHRRYSRHGLTVLGVHLSRYPFTDDAAAIGATLPRLEIDWPVARDSDRSIQRDYGAEGWPCLFLWGRGGALRWYHLGEGEYAATEEAIRDALAEGEAGVDVLGMPPVMDPLRPSDAPGAEVVVPTPEYVHDGLPIEIDYEAGGAYATVEGSGELPVRIDGAESSPIRIERSGLVAIAEHPAHERHSLQLDPPAGVVVHSLQFAPGIRPGRPGSG